MIIVIEGPDGVGKTTLCKALAQRLDGVYVSFPGREAGTLGKWVYDLHHTDLTINPTALQALHIAAHIDTLNRFVLPAVNRGQTVILDRSFISTLVYGAAYGASVTTVMDLVDAEQTYWEEIECLPKLVTYIILQDQPFSEFERGLAKWLEINRQYKLMVAIDKYAKFVPITSTVLEQRIADVIAHINSL